MPMPRSATASDDLDPSLPPPPPPPRALRPPPPPPPPPPPGCRRPAALHLRRLLDRDARPTLGGTPLLVLRIVVSGIGVALFYTALSMAISSLTTRRAVAAVATVLVLLVSSVAVGVAVESSGAPDELALLTPGVATELPGGRSATNGPADGHTAISRVSTGLVVAGLAGWIALGAAVCLVSYRRQSGRR